MSSLNEMSWYERGICAILLLGVFFAAAVLGPAGWSTAVAYRQPLPRPTSTDACVALVYWEPRVRAYTREIAIQYRDSKTPKKDLLIDLFEASGNYHTAAKACGTSRPEQIDVAVQGIMQAAASIADFEDIRFEVMPVPRNHDTPSQEKPPPNTL